MCFRECESEFYLWCKNTFNFSLICPFVVKLTGHKTSSPSPSPFISLSNSKFTQTRYESGGKAVFTIVVIEESGSGQNRFSCYTLFFRLDP